MRFHTRLMRPLKGFGSNKKFVLTGVDVYSAPFEYNNIRARKFARVRSIGGGW